MTDYQIYHKFSSSIHVTESLYTRSTSKMKKDAVYVVLFSASVQEKQKGGYHWSCTPGAAVSAGLAC